jgi:hypothetical protein
MRLARAKARPRSREAEQLVSEAEGSVNLLRDQLTLIAHQKTPNPY